MIHGVPTALSSREVRALQDLARGRKVVEAGALLGGSTIIMARVAREVVSIDRHEGYTAPTLRQFMSNMDRAGVSNVVRPVVGNAHELLDKHPAELAFIDLTGRLEDTLAALKAVRAPIVAVHDLCRSHCEGVEAAIRASGLHIVGHVDTLAICVR